MPFQGLAFALSCKCCNFLLELSFSSEIAMFVKEFAIHLSSDILPSSYNKLLADVFIFNFCFSLYCIFKAFGFISIMPGSIYLLGSGKVSFIVCSCSCCHDLIRLVSQ